MRRPPRTLSSREQAMIIRLLGELQTYLESVIECHVAEGEREPREDALKPIVWKARRDWSQAEGFVKRFSA